MAQAATLTTDFRVRLAAFTLLLFALGIAAMPLRVFAGAVHPDLEARLATLPVGAWVPVIVELAEQANPAASAAAAPAFDRRARGRAVVQALREVAARTQPPVRAWLAREAAAGGAREARAFWVINGFALDATEPAIRRLAARGDVREVRFDRPIRPPLPQRSVAPKAAEPVWNLEIVRAPEVWAIDPAFTGTGIVIGSFDTGVDGTHPDLAPRYRGDHARSWFDPYGQHASPYDGIGHGTHTVGTMVGGEASGYSIGVAPGARWIAAKGWNDADQATASAFHQIFEWFLAPGGDPAEAPHIVNNSWGMESTLCEAEFQADVRALRAAGIVPVFASGNSGPDAGTVLAPGSYAESFTVGATDFFDDVAAFSSQGPSSCDGGVKPNISAPGVFILSTFPGGNYAYLDGTSMAAPHVSGAAAVLLSIAPDLTVEEVEAVLASGAVDLGPAGPDNAFGYGRLDLMESARIALESSGQSFVGISATTPSALEAGTVAGAFTARRGGDTTQALTLTYQVSGTASPGSDYVALPGSVTIAAGATSATIAVTPIDDPFGELDESVTVTLDAAPGYVAAPARATVLIVSDELPPDFVVESLTSPPSAGAGDTIALGDTTRNAGAGLATASTTRYYLSADAILDAADIVLASRSVPALAPGASHAGSASATLPAATPAGTYFILVKADGDDAQLETEEANNVTFRSLQLGPDLAVWGFGVPWAAAAGQAITVTDTTRNQGPGAAPASTTAFYLSSDAALDAADIALGSRAVPALAAGDSHAASTAITIPAGTATGSYYVIARADAADAVAELYESNNTLGRTVAVGPDLQVTNLAAPGAAGAGTTITVTDTTRNVGAGAAAASTTRFLLSSNALPDAADVLLGTRAVPALASNASSAASVSLTIPAGTANGIYYVIAVADGDGVVPETQEGNNAYAASLLVGADLAVSSLDAPADAGAGRPLLVADTTKNQGAGASAASTTAFYLSVDVTLDASDALLGSRAVPALAAGATSSASTTLAIPPATATGTYYVLARADDGNAVPETLEANNVAYRAVRVGPDLQVASVSAPTTGGAGTTITVTDTTRNNGGAPSAASTTRFYLSSNPTLDGADAVLGARAVPALEAGASSSASVALAIAPETAAGTYWIIAQADADGAVAETLEANNVLAATIAIGADLSVSSFIVPSIGGAGLSLTLTDTTVNLGAGAAATSTTRFHLSTNNTFDEFDLVLGTRAVPALAAGASSTGSTAVTIPAGTAPGTYYVIARADAGGAVAEIYEVNNTLPRAIVIGPDLRMDALTVPATAGAGTTISVSDSTRNAGGGTAPATTTRFYLSANTALEPGDTLLGVRAVPALGASTSHAGSVGLALPAGIPGGTYWIIARADGDDAVAETQEGNNELARSLVIGADLVVTSFAAPADGGAGLAITVTDTTRNLSAGAAAASSTTYHLSANAILDASDVALGSRAVPALAASASDTGSVAVTIPASTATGTYYLFARADGGEAVAETNETNNTLSRTIRMGPDLVVSSLAAPAATGAGESILLTDTTRNAGGGGAAASVTRFYLSSNPTFEAADVLLGQRTAAGLAPAASDSGSLTVTIPAGTAAGSYWIIAKADGDDALAETQESNNTLTRTLQVGADLAIAGFAVPRASDAGLAITLTETTRNQGAGAAGASTTTFYLSTNSTLDASDVALGSRAVAALAPGASDSGSTTVTLPAGTAAGSYYVIARADGAEAVAEIYETNNTLARMLGVGPDLMVTNIGVPASAAAGASIAVTDTTRNNGGGAAAASATRLYLSKNAFLDATDILLGARAVPSLGVGASHAGATSLTIPAGTAPGWYYVIAVADGAGEVAEMEEVNNTYYAAIQVSAP